MQDGNVLEQAHRCGQKGRSPTESLEQEHSGVFHPRSKVAEYTKEKAPEGQGSHKSLRLAY
jgi:hypothetical protein